MITQQNMVREFMKAFGQEIPTEAGKIDSVVRMLRYGLIDEENKELLAASNNIEALDGIADLLYVVLGAALAYGFTPEHVEAAFAEVHRSNMSKLWTASEFLAHMRSGGSGIEFDEPNPDRPYARFIARRPDGKVIKSPSYSPANLAPIVGGAR